MMTDYVSAKIHLETPHEEKAFAKRRCLFMCEEMNLLYCPNCNNYVGRWDGHSEVKIKTICRKCWTMVLYDPKSKRTSTCARPPRTTSSGCRIW